MAQRPFIAMDWCHQVPRKATWLAAKPQTLIVTLRPHRVDDTAIFQNLFGILMHLPRHLAEGVQVGGPTVGHRTWPFVVVGRAKITRDVPRSYGWITWKSSEKGIVCSSYSH